MKSIAGILNLTACGLAVSLSGCGGASGLSSGAYSSTTVSAKHEGGPAAGPAAPGKTADGGGAPAAAGGVGSLKGKVVLKGSVPERPPLLQKGADIKEALCVAKAAIPNESLVVGEGNGVANVFVFLPKAPAGAAVPPPGDKPVTFDQVSCRFTPHALLARAGQTVKVLNSDDVAHNTHTFTQKNDPFNQLLAVHDNVGKEIKYKLAEAAPIEVKCDIHAWMRAYHLPLNHPWGAVSGPNGEFEIKDLPAGTHKLSVWHESATGKYITRNLSVTIKPGETANVTIDYDASKVEG